MKNYFRKWGAIALLSCGINILPAWGQTSTAQTDSTYHKRMSWFDEAKLGIFIHWGIYSVGDVSESWSFFNGRISYENYMKQAQQFTAAQYDPKTWVSLIKESGARYTVLTTKHHDGFALWDTQYSKLNSKDGSPAKRDLITPFVEEVRKQGLKFGAYYSLIDWSHKDYPNHTKDITRYKIKDDPARWERFCKFNMGQLTEVNTLWKPDLIWFDGDWEQDAATWNSTGVINLLRSTNPNVVVNSRIQGYGDYATPEIGVPCSRPSARYWELCYTINNSWGYRKQDQNFKTPQMLLTTFVDCLSKGGNLLLDITPKADGSLLPENIEVLKAFGKWIKKYEKAVYKTRAGIPGDYFIGYTTVSPDRKTLYLYLPYKPIGKVQLKAIINNVKSIREVSSGEEIPFKLYNKLSWSEVPGIIYFDIPERLLDEYITVLEVELEDELKVYKGEGQVITAN